MLHEHREAETPMNINTLHFWSAICSFLVCLYSPLVSADSDDWNLRYSQDGLNVYTKHIEGAQIKSFRAEMEVDVPLQQVLAVIKDVKHYSNWFHLCRSYEVVQGAMDLGEYIGYYVVEAPWPLKDRDVYVKNVMTQDPDTHIVTILTNAVPDFKPVNTEFTRVPEVYGRWTFKPLSPERTYIEFIGHGHPGGIIPVWIANLVVTDVPKKSFLNLRALFDDPKNRQNEVLGGPAADLNASNAH